MTPWPHQLLAVRETVLAWQRGERRVCVTTPTGGGKTLEMILMIEEFRGLGMRKCALYTNRKLLVEQTSRMLGLAGVSHGSRAAGWEDEREFDVQICTPQTEQSRVYRRKEWHLHDADLVLVDEAHLNSRGEVMRKIMAAHEAEGALIVGLTATPIGLGADYTHLVVAGTNSELRACGALVSCVHYGPDEPDLRQFQKLQVGADLSEAQNRKAIMTPGIFGRVLEWFGKLNPDRRPTILFAPGVPESAWFAEQFHKAGVSAAHIDGEDCWVAGEWHHNDFRVRQQILKGSEDGSIHVLCNRFVLREGVDAPWLGHGIFATVFGSLQSYLQSGGRLLRSHPALGSVTLQDHGGNWHRHGSLNADRAWDLAYTGHVVSGLREDRLRSKAEREPARCPQCAAVVYGVRCHHCGHVRPAGKKSRPVVQSDGTLREYSGDVYKRRRLCQKPEGPKLWERVYIRARKSGMTFGQARGLFALENHWAWPDPAWPLMPTQPLDWYRRVDEVDAQRLVPKEANREQP